MSTAVEPAIVTRPSRPASAASSRGGHRWSFRASLNGLLIVAVATLIFSISHRSRYMTTLPFSEWFPLFLDSLLSNGTTCFAMLLAAIGVRSLLPSRGAMRYVAAAGAIVVAVVAVHVGFQAYWAWRFDEPFRFIDGEMSFARNLLYVGATVFGYSIVGLLVTSAWLYLCSEAEHAAAAEQCVIDAARMDRQATEARLQVLEAQIEPHFLFNTLAHVKRLYETDHAAGARMLRNLSDYLAGALPQMREASTLGRELDHISAYINIQQIRMGRRLAFAIDVPDALREVELPPLMVLTLVENAIKHGLSSLPEGGRIDVRASVADGSLVIQVADTGRGFAKSSGGGTGLANTRARLASKYGPGASLSLALNQPRGVVATVAVPYEATTTAQAAR